jgi:RNA polymerase sigma-70 factor (ECF subfamily)
MDREDVLITAAQQGDLRAFNQLVLDYQGLAYRVAYHILADGDAAADATQDSFLKAFRSMKRYHGGSFKAWLMRVLTNTCYDQLRFRRRHPAHSLEDLEATMESTPWLTDRHERPADYAERNELGRVIQRGMRILAEDQRTVIVLSDVEGFTYEQIAEITGMPMGTVKSRLSRARAHLRDYLLRQKDLLPAQYRAACTGPAVTNR